MGVQFTTKIDGDNPFIKMLENVKSINGHGADAGVFDGFAAQKAMWQEYGTSRGIPSRPFLRNTLYSKSSQWAEEISPLLQDLMFGNSTTEEITNKLGVMMRQSIKKTIDEQNFVPLKPATVRAKGSSMILIDTGDMYNAIDYKRI